jgi:hypothetical protein
MTARHVSNRIGQSGYSDSRPRACIRMRFPITSGSTGFARRQSNPASRASTSVRLSAYPVTAIISGLRCNVATNSLASWSPSTFGNPMSQTVAHGGSATAFFVRSPRRKRRARRTRPRGEGTGPSCRPSRCSLRSRERRCAGRRQTHWTWGLATWAVRGPKKLDTRRTPGKRIPERLRFSFHHVKVGWHNSLAKFLSGCPVAGFARQVGGRRAGS